MKLSLNINLSIKILMILQQLLRFKLSSGHDPGLFLELAHTCRARVSLEHLCLLPISFSNDPRLRAFERP